MCTLCGREVCKDCFERVAQAVGSLADRKVDKIKVKAYPATLTRMISCKDRHAHYTDTFRKVLRIPHPQLSTTVNAMRDRVAALSSASDPRPLNAGRNRLDTLPAETQSDVASLTRTYPDAAPLFCSPTPSRAGPSFGDSKSAIVSPASETSPTASATPSTAISKGHPSSPPFHSLSARPQDRAPSTDHFPTAIPAPDPSHVKNTMPPIMSHETPHYKDGEGKLDEGTFHKIWEKGTPIVVTNCYFRCPWTPGYFIEHYGDQTCTLVECQTGREEESTVATFFGMLGGPRSDTGSTWKLKDWPPTSDFRTSFPELFEDFEKSVPMPSYTRRDGVLNIASHYPKNALAPDLGKCHLADTSTGSFSRKTGPKMYNAFATFETSGSKGSTRLHMDVADAVNIMLWSKHPPGDASTEPPCAAWDIFRAEDADRLRELMREHFEDASECDPIHSQDYYLDEDVRRKFSANGVLSHRIYQHVGEAVFIPAGCAHQASSPSPLFITAKHDTCPTGLQSS